MGECQTCHHFPCICVKVRIVTPQHDWQCRPCNQRGGRLQSDETNGQFYLENPS